MTGASGIAARFQGDVGGFHLDVDFEAPASGVTALFGASGSGKTTVLRCIAGLQRLDGRFSLGGEVWQDETTFRPTHTRPIGYVFQEASLFPHLSVRDNLMFGRRRAAIAPGRPEIRFDEVVSLLGIAPLLDRATTALSGGERQRVAIGRALLSQPALLLMDEPLSALDRPTKDEILPFLEGLHGALSLPVLYVSHDMAEVERLADRVVLLERGRVLGAGPLAAVQADPALPLVRRRDAAATLDAVAGEHDALYGLLTLHVDGGRLVVPAPAAAAGEHRRIRIEAGDVSLAREAPKASSITNILPARILERLEGDKGQVIVVLGLGEDGTGARLLARLTLWSWDHLELAVGQAVLAQVKGVALVPGRAEA
ncbi:molybdenum ABC transporter ATP-binding protein [uncultured Alsobacter sp.]|uniref:molybdenum ABC transporter ATP-binding protein n=1 Tax=uncultured Alsobacter sp. TaxID=1748258 RepID=UPI0025F37E88|nr:molybdenum ABC transporter ATP-binding protein [uncultured Alsobacter sp.]